MFQFLRNSMESLGALVTCLAQGVIGARSVVLPHCSAFLPCPWAAGSQPSSLPSAGLTTHWQTQQRTLHPAQCVPEMAKRTQEGLAGKDGARETSPFPGQLKDWVVHLYPVPADTVNKSSCLGSPSPTHTGLPKCVVHLCRRRSTSTDDRRPKSKAFWICKHFTWFQAFKVQGYSLPAAHL